MVPSSIKGNRYPIPGFCAFIQIETNLCVSYCHPDGRQDHLGCPQAGSAFFQ